MMGHNSINAETRKQLASYIDRIERLEEERKAIGQDIRDVLAEAKSNGFDTKALKEILRLRKMDAAARAEWQSIVDLYVVALGMAPAEANELAETLG